MKYYHKLPKLDELNRLSQALAGFPVSVARAVRTAEGNGCSRETIDFLNLFHGEFESRSDFYARTTELAVLIREEQDQPEEVVLSQQD